MTSMFILIILASSNGIEMRFPLEVFKTEKECKVALEYARVELSKDSWEVNAVCIERVIK